MAAVKDYQTYIQKGGYGDCEEVSEERQALLFQELLFRCLMCFNPRQWRSQQKKVSV